MNYEHRNRESFCTTADSCEVCYLRSQCSSGGTIYLCDGDNPLCQSADKKAGCRLAGKENGCRHTTDVRHAISRYDEGFPTVRLVTDDDQGILYVERIDEDMLSDGQRNRYADYLGGWLFDGADDMVDGVAVPPNGEAFCKREDRGIRCHTCHNISQCSDGTMLYLCDGNDPRCSDNAKDLYCRLVTGRPGCRHTPNPRHAVSRCNSAFPETEFRPMSGDGPVFVGVPVSVPSVEGSRDIWIEKIRDDGTEEEHHDGYEPYYDWQDEP